MSPEANHLRVREICEQFCERPLDGDAMRELESLMIDDPVAQAIYLQYVHLETQLGLEFGGGRHLAARRERRQSVVQGKNDSARQWHVRQFANRRRWVATVLAVASAVLVMLWWGQRAGPPQRSGSVAFLSADVQWNGSTSEPTVGQALLSGSYELVTGEARIALDRGAMVHVTSPCRLTLVDTNHIGVAEGRVAAFVPRSAAGFAVEIPGATVVDRGTQFAVSVQSNGVSQTHVAEGQIDVLPAGDAARSLVGGDAVRFDPGERTLMGIAFDDTLFADGGTLRIASHTGDGKVLATGKVDTREWPGHRILRVGMGGPARGRSGCAIVYFFELPQLSHLSDLQDAVLELHYIGYQDPKPRTWGPKLKDMHADLVALGTRSAPVVRTSDYGEGASGSASKVIVIQHEFVDASTKPGVQTLSELAHAALLRYLREHAYRPDGTPTGRYLAMRLSPNAKMPRGRFEIRGFVFSEAECSFPGDQPPQLTLRVASLRNRS